MFYVLNEEMQFKKICLFDSLIKSHVIFAEFGTELNSTKKLMQR